MRTFYFSDDSKMCFGTCVRNINVLLVFYTNKINKLLTNNKWGKYLNNMEWQGADKYCFNTLFQLILQWFYFTNPF